MTSKKESATCILGVVVIFVSTPIWYFIVYRVLKQIGADDTTWVLFWIYMPLQMTISVLHKVAETLFAE